MIFSFQESVPLDFHQEKGTRVRKKRTPYKSPKGYVFVLKLPRLGAVSRADSTEYIFSLYSYTARKALEKVNLLFDRPLILAVIGGSKNFRVLKGLKWKTLSEMQQNKVLSIIRGSSLTSPPLPLSQGVLEKPFTPPDSVSQVESSQP